jgi:hypothetical protein
LVDSGKRKEVLSQFISGEESLKLDKRLEAILTKKVELERLKVEDETLRSWQERIELSVRKSNDYRSLEVNIKKVLETIENRLQVLQSEIRDLN